MLVAPNYFNVISNKSSFQEISEWEILIKNQTLQIFFELMINSNVIFKGIYGPDYSC